MHYRNGQQPTFGRANSGGASFAQNARASQGGWNTQQAQAPATRAAYDGGRQGQTPGRTVNGLRFVSGIVDTIVVGILMIAVIAVFAFIEVTFMGENPIMKPIGILLSLIAAFFYGVFMESSAMQGTVGKLVTNTIITDYQGERISLGRAFGRNLGKLVSTLIPLYIPYFMVMFTDRNQALHDMMAKTLVCKNLGDTQSSADMNRIFA